MQLPDDVIEPYLRQLTEPVEAVYRVVDGLELHVSWTRPRDADGPLPAVLWVPGGGWGWRGPGTGYRSTTGVQLAARGAVLVGVQYRASTQAHFPAQIHDCKAAVRWVREHAGQLGADPDRIGAWGRSAGGHLVALLGTSAGARELQEDGQSATSDAVQTVVDCFGPTDLSRFTDDLAPDREQHVRKLLRFFFGGEVEEVADQLPLANPLRYARADAPPFLFVHGEQDPTVLIAQSRILLDRLRQLGVPSDLLAVANAAHGLLPTVPEVSIDPPLAEIHRQICDFFLRHLS